MTTNFSKERVNRDCQAFDTLLELKDAGLVAASAAAEVGSVRRVLDIGAGSFEGAAHFVISACEVDDTDELYIIGTQFSNSVVRGAASISIGAGGTGYTLNDVLTVVQTGGSALTVTATGVTGTVVDAVTITTPGGGYNVEDNLATTGGTGTGCLIDIDSVSDNFASSFMEGSSFFAGAAAVVKGDIDVGAGKYIFPVTNNFDGTFYRYVRLYTTVSGTITTGINYRAYLTKDPV